MNKQKIANINLVTKNMKEKSKEEVELSPKLKWIRRKWINKIQTKKYKELKQELKLR